jgi:dienelactone hydrolase
VFVFGKRIGVALGTGFFFIQLQPVSAQHSAAMRSWRARRGFIAATVAGFSGVKSRAIANGGLRLATVPHPASVPGMKRRTFSLLLLAAAAFTTSAFAAVKTESITYKDGDVELEGFIAYDDTVSSLSPGVLVIHDWTGLQDYTKSRVKQLAELGYVAFAADIYGKGVRPTDPKECAVQAGTYKNDLPLLRRRVLLGLEQLKKKTNVDSAKLAAIGYCFGGTSVLELARSGADVRGVVSFHGGLSTSQPAKPGGIKARILVCHGAADSHVNKEVPAFKEEMAKAKAQMEFITYDGALHGFTKPGPAYQEKADKESWAAMRKFFADILK